MFYMDLEFSETLYLPAASEKSPLTRISQQLPKRLRLTIMEDWNKIKTLLPGERQALSHSLLHVASEVDDTENHSRHLILEHALQAPPIKT